VSTITSATVEENGDLQFTASNGESLCTYKSPNIEAAHNELVAKGINASEVFHGSPFSPAGRISGPDPERQSYRSYVTFEDPDGNVWIVQEVTRRLPDRIDPAMTTFASASGLASAIRRAAAAHGEHENEEVTAFQAGRGRMSATDNATRTGRTGTQRTWGRSKQGLSCRCER
jgi:hypothetical protein